MAMRMVNRDTISDSIPAVGLLGVAGAGATGTGKMTAASQDSGPDILVAVMGATGTGKSTFINLLTDDERIHIGHDPESETSDIQTARYVDEKTGLSVLLIDTPGFDDSHEGVTDTDILEKIVRFLEPERGERRKLNGIIYMHRISDPRVGGVSRKNLRIFRSLCGEANLGNVRIVTTNWARVTKEEGDNREVALQVGAFKALLDAQAGMRRHLNTVESARMIVSELIPLKAVTMQIQHELEAGMTLGNTTAGTVLTAEMREMQKKHEKELAGLKREMGEAAKANDLALRAELAEDRRALEQKMARAEEDRERLAGTLDQDLAAEQDKLHALRRRTDEQSAALKQLQDQTEEERKRLADQIKDTEEKRRKLEMEQKEAMRKNKFLVKQLETEQKEAMRKNESLVKQLETERQDIRDQAAKRAAALMDAQAKMVAETERLATEIKAGEDKRQKLEEEQREAVRRNGRLTDQLAKERQDQLEEARKQSEALRNTQLKMDEDAKRLAIQIKADEDKRRKLEEEQKKAKLENDLLMKRLAAEREGKIREAQANELALRKKADELHQRQAMYEAEIARVEAAQQKLERHAERADLEDTTESLRAQDERSNAERIADLEEVLQEVRIHLVTSQQERANLNAIIGNSAGKTTHLEETIRELRTELTTFQQQANSLLRAHEQKHQCEVLYAAGHINDAAQTLLEITNTVSSEVRANRLIMDWLAEFTTKCISTLETMGDRQSNAEKHDEALASYFTALSLTSSNPDTLLRKWASQVLIRGSAKEALCTAYKFKLPRFAVYRVICDALEADGRVTEAIECFRQMQSELVNGTIVQDERAQWELDFRQRCIERLMNLGDVATESKDHALAIQQYSDALTLDPTNSRDILLKRSKVRALNGLWEEALADADKVIELDPSLPWGHERKHAALLGAQRYDEAINAYSDMLLKLEQSPDPATRELRGRFVTPSQTKAAIRTSVKRNQQDVPLVLINTESGHLRNTHERSEEFEADPTFKELVASMTKLENPRITQTVEEYFRYATFSHTWEGAEPLFHHVLRDPVHTLPTTPTAFKLVMFCKTAREAGLHWAWSDTCCIDKTDSSVLQESLTSMFKWYHKSSLTIIHLKDVWSNSQLRALIDCVWNTRAWTLQEFFASRIIRFYTEDWKPYLPQEDMRNHKDSSEMMAEMAAVTGVDAQVLLSLRPGSENVRQKLRLAATRTATKQEDMAYSLFGIFDVSIPATYGEGQERALGRLLQEVLTRSGDLTILAWTGTVSEFNSCLPADISVYREPASPHVPSPIEDVEMARVVTELRSSLGDLNSAIKLYDLVIRLPPPRLASRRLSLSCVMFPLGELLVSGVDGQYVYRTMTAAFGKVEIKTTENLPILDNLVLVHPWLRCLLDPVPPFEDLDVNIPFDVVDGDHISDSLPTDVHSPSSSHTMSTSRRSSQPRLDKLTRALRFFARLRQPFGALLLVPLSHSEYKRVASDNPIVVQLRKDVSPRHLVQMTRSLDIL